VYSPAAASLPLQVEGVVSNRAVAILVLLVEVVAVVVNSQAAVNSLLLEEVEVAEEKHRAVSLPRRPLQFLLPLPVLLLK
jgi:hypothetical protein